LEKEDKEKSKSLTLIEELELDLNNLIRDRELVKQQLNNVQGAINYIANKLHSLKEKDKKEE